MRTSLGVKDRQPTDAERHKRFVAMAHEVEVSESPEDFERAFKKIVCPHNVSSSSR